MTRRKKKERKVSRRIRDREKQDIAKAQDEII